MADTKFTPGPWSVGFPDGTGRKKDKDFGIFIIAPAIYNNPELMRKTTSDGVVVRAASGKHAQTVPQGIWNEADAHLIAAAPELYAALLAVEWSVGEPETGYYCPSCERHKDIGHRPNDCQLDAALRKARGEA